MDSRTLRELELLPVARLYGFEAPQVQPEAARAPAPVPVPAREEKPRDPLGLVLCKPRGNDAARWAVVGDVLEGPAAALLDNMLAAIGARREGEPQPFAARELKRLAPRLAVAFGAAAAARLLEAEADLQSLRGQVHSCDGIPVVVTHDAVHLLRHGADKAQAWEDLLLARRTAGDD